MKVFLSPDHLVLEPLAEVVLRMKVLPREHLKAKVELEQEKLVSEEDSAEAPEAEIEMRE